MIKFHNCAHMSPFSTIIILFLDLEHEESFCKMALGS
jgi:hypothetical protein